MPGSEAVFLDPPNDAQYKILWVPVPPLPRPKKQARTDLESNWGCLAITKGSEDGWDDFHGGLHPNEEWLFRSDGLPPQPNHVYRPDNTCI
jgi:hypothetical protein